MISARRLLLALAAAASLGGARDASASGADGAVVRLPGVEVAGMPRTYVTITIAIPEQLRDAQLVTFEVRLSGLTDVVGRTEGVLRPTESRRVILTLRVPAEALVGVLDVADVVFRGDDGDEFIVPIFLRVPAVRGYSATGTREFRGLRAGDRVELAYHVMNHGNAPDTLEYAIRAPAGWIVRPGGTRQLIIPARARVEIPMSVTVPAIANVGDHMVSLWARPRRDSVERREVSTVLGVTAPNMRNGGFILRPAVALATGGGESAGAVAAELVGPIADGVMLSVRAASQPSVNGLPSLGLATVGATGAPLSGALSGSDWIATAGYVGVQIGDLTGMSVSGQGVQFTRDNENTRVRAIAARGRENDRSAGSLIGASYSQRISSGRVGGGLSFLQEPGGAGVGRELAAVGVDYTSSRIGTIVAGGELAYRSSVYGSGLGAAVALSHARSGEQASVRFSHAPGGSAAFARAVNLVEANAARTLTDRWSADFSFIRAEDQGRVVERSVSSMWTLAQRYRLTENGNLSLRARSSSIDAERSSSAFGGYGLEDRALTAGADWQFGPTRVSGEVEQGVVVRRTQLLGGANADASSGQRGVRADVSRDFRALGELAAGVALQQTGAGVGLPSESWSANARWASNAVLLLGRPAQLTSSVGFQRFGQQNGVVLARGGIRMALPAGLDLLVALERNPYFRDAQGRIATVAAFRLSTSGRIFSTAMLGPDGWVFEDRNLNGRRDPDEPGVGGVMIRRGADRVVSRRDGRYRLPAAARGRTNVELGSIPAGLVAHPMLGAETTEIRDIPLLPTGSVTVTLTLTPDDEGRLPNVDLRLATVLLKDATGFEWVGRATEDNKVVFDGIPTGTYDFRLDISQLREAVRVPADLKVKVLPHARALLDVPVRGRLIRIISPPARDGTSGRGSGRGGAR